VGKALVEAGKQAARNAKHSPQGAIGSDAVGVGNATSGSLTDQLTRQHRMTLDEAQLILNVRRGDEMKQVMESYERLFKMNSPPTKPPSTGKPGAIPSHSHYLQSKVVRARERLEAEIKGPTPADAPVGDVGPKQPPPPPPEAPN